MTYAINTILYSTDLGPRSLEVFHHAVGLAAKFQAKLEVVTVIEAAGDYANVTLDSYVPADIVAQIRQDGVARIRENIDARIAAYQENHPEVDVRGLISEVKILEGAAADALLDEAKAIGADMIVLGSHGHTALGEMLIGSVAHKVTMRAQVPVVLVPINY